MELEDCLPATTISRMNIKQLHENWSKLGAEDPMWVVLTDPAKKGNRWDEDEFFETGRAAILEVIRKLQANGISLRFDRALDFGCGLGRLSQALAEHFAAVDGVDISTSMIDQARKLNRHGQKIAFHLNIQPDLQAFGSESYDFVYSVIALQHAPAKFQIRYIADFIRLLRPGGIAWFQTIHARSWRRFVPETVVDVFRRRRAKGEAFIPMYGVPETSVQKALQVHGGIVRQRENLSDHDGSARYVTDVYIVQKRG